ncbi:hypothetical protein TWF730_001469 [Orbilia blumenaviensis]|uniref:Uncharacterized protein n=1 Tax=Orbilia blumenaviensis TaxID=1796055 RepID=A0AAV9UNZ7_9PEZI
MHFSTLINAAVTVLTFADLSSAHCVFVDTWGNKDGSIHGFGLGFNSGFHRKGFAQWPQQADIAVFNRRAVHTGWWKGYTPQGCGVSIWSVTSWYQKHNLALWNKKKGWLWSQDAPHGAHINIQDMMWWTVDSEKKKGVRHDIASGRKGLRNGVAKVTAGGAVNVLVWQVNLDGGGPFKCRLEDGVTGQNFKWDVPVVHNKCHGDKNSLNLKGVQKLCQFTVQLPTHLNCHNDYNGLKKVCMIRCENFAKNGPFGGCFPIQQIVDPPPKPIVSIIRLPPQTVFVTKGAELTVTKGDVVAVPQTSVVTVTQVSTVSVTNGMVLTVTVGNGVRRTTFTRKQVVTVTNALPTTVVKDATVTVTEEGAITVTEDSTVTVTKAPQVTTVTSSANPGGKGAVPSISDVISTTKAPPATKTPTKEEVDAATGGEDIDPEDLKEVEKEKIDGETKEQLKEEAEEVKEGRKEEEVPDNVEDIDYF